MLLIAGEFREFWLPTPDSYPQGITAGPDGAIWFTEAFGNKIGRITTGGRVTEFTIPTLNYNIRKNSSLPQGITAGPDGHLWFTESAGNQIGRVTTTPIARLKASRRNGMITEFPIPTGARPGTMVYGI